MSERYNFQNDLNKALGDSNLDMPKKDLLVQIFKTMVAEVLRTNIAKNGIGRLEAGVIEELRRSIIHEFRSASIDDVQMSVKMYENLFDSTLQEILNYASLAHEGEDAAKFDYNRDISVNARAHDAKFSKQTPGGIYLP